MRRVATLGTITASLLVAGTAVSFACGGLVAPNGTVQLLRTSTLAAYHDGVEHYITAFSFAGEGELGSIVPLPAVPTKVQRGGDWTLQRLRDETQPQQVALTAASPGSAEDAEVLYETRIDALDITILKGGALAVGTWARTHGYLLPPDAPEVLDFYARRSQIFMAARFDAKAARERGQRAGDGTPIHLTMRTRNPWVPLRILSLGQPSRARVEADVYVLTDRRPALTAGPGAGLFVGYNAPASKQLLNDLRSDKGMSWVPRTMWLTYLRLDESAGRLRYDLAVDASGRGKPSLVDAGLVRLRSAKGIAPSLNPAIAGEPDRSPQKVVVVPALRAEPVASRTGEVAVGAAGVIMAAALLAGALVRRRSFPT